MSGSAAGPLPEELRERVLAAAYDELIRWGIDRFSIVALADRHGLDPGAIRQQWGNEGAHSTRHGARFVLTC
jgi:hypothetical protein